MFQLVLRGSAHLGTLTTLTDVSPQIDSLVLFFTVKWIQSHLLLLTLEFFLFCVSVVSRMVCGAAVDRHENDRQRHRAVFKFLDTSKDRRAEEESVSATTVEYSQDGKDEEEYDDDYYEEYEDGMSGDYEMELPRGTADACADFVWSKFCF